MIDNNSIKSIIANGGWCEINPKDDTPLIEQLNGRLVFHTSDSLVIQKFNLDLEILDGFYLFFKPKVKKLRKGYWIKKYLTVGGHLQKNIEAPAEYMGANWFEVLENLQRSKELLKFKLKSQSIFGSVKIYTSIEIQVSPAFLTESNSKKDIALDELICIEARTKEIDQVTKEIRRQLT